MQVTTLAGVQILDFFVTDGIDQHAPHDVTDGRLALGDVDRAVGVRRLEPSVSDQLRAVLALLDTVDYDIDFLTYMPGRCGEAGCLSDVLQTLGALELDIVRYLPVHTGGPGALLGGIGEDGRVIEALFREELAELVRLLVGLAGKSGHAGRAQYHAGNLAPQAGEELGELLARPGPAHALEHATVAVLNGYVDIGQNLGRVAYGRDELVSHALRLQVEHTHPTPHGSHDGCHLTKKGCERLRLPEIAAPDAGVLTDQYYLTYAALDQRLYFRDNILCRARAIAAADVGNGAEGAIPVAALGNLHEGACPIDGPQDLPGRSLPCIVRKPQDLVDDRHDRIFLVSPNESSHLGQLTREVVAVT